MGRLVWISLATSNGRKALIGSGPRYLVISRGSEHTTGGRKEQGHDEVGVSDCLRAIPQFAPSYFRVMR